MKPGKHVEIKKFARAIVANGGNATQAVLDTGKKIKRQSARRRGSDLLKRKEVREEIEIALKETGIDFNYVLGTRKDVIDKGKEQLSNGVRGKTDVIVSPKDMHSHLQGIESILLRTGDNGNYNKQNNKHLHLHLEEKDQKELLTKRQELNNWFTDIIDNE